MHTLKNMFIIAFSFVLLLTNVKATSCGYEEQAKLNNEISNVKTNYEIKERIMDPSEYDIPDAIVGTEAEASYVEKTEYIVLNILNLTENMYVEVTNDYNDEVSIYEYNAENKGNISIEWHNINELVTFTVKVYASNVTSCSGDLLKTMTQKLPRYNSYSNYGLCENFPDYYLCQRFVTYKEVDYYTFYDKIMTLYEEANQDEEKGKKETDKWYEKVKDFIVNNKVAFITGGVLLIVIAGGTTFVIIKKQRRSII